MFGFHSFGCFVGFVIKRYRWLIAASGRANFVS
jgi:hypothetical protein